MIYSDTDTDPLASDSVQLAAPLAFAEERRLILDYQIANGLSEEIYLVNRLFIWTGDGMLVDPDLIYTQLLGSRLRLSKAFVDVPDGLDEEPADAPFLTEVAPYAYFEERIEVPLPLEPFHPYHLLDWQDRVHQFAEVELALGWLPASEVDTRLVQGRRNQLLLAADPGQVRYEQRLLVTGLTVTVLAHFGPED